MVRPSTATLAAEPAEAQVVLPVVADLYHQLPSLPAPVPAAQPERVRVAVVEPTLEKARAGSRVVKAGAASSAVAQVLLL